MKALTISIACTAATATPALGQYERGWIIRIDYGPGRWAVSPEHPSATVTCLATFNPNTFFAVAGLGFDLRAGQGTWSSPRNLPPLTIGANPGVISGSVVQGIRGSQLHFPAAGIFADPSNPIAAWSGVWTATDFRVRQVPISTFTSRFDVFGYNWPVEPPRGGATEALAFVEVETNCYPDCDTTTGPGILDIFDFLCFQNRYDTGSPYACECDTTTGPGVCDVFDFLCFQNLFAAGCP